MDFTFKKIERLCSKKAIDDLFANGKSKTQFPFKLIYKVSDIKRRMREVYRLNKHILYQSLQNQKIDLMFICLSNEELEYPIIEKSMLQLIETLGKVEFLVEPK